MAGDDDGDCAMLEPFFYDEAATVAEATAAAERRERERQEWAREKAARAKRWAAREAVLNSIKEYDTDEGRYIYTRYYFDDDLDLDEESLLAPMRFTATTYAPGQALRFLCNMVNVLDIRIILPSDSDDDAAAAAFGFPISVYGSVIARDMLDLKCIPLFRRSRDHPQLITSQDELSLILTGPHRGLLLSDAIYIEVDLKVKMQEGCEDRPVSKGLLVLDGVRLTTSSTHLQTVVKTTTLMRRSFRPCTVDVTYAFLRCAVEATISVKLLHQGAHFCGQITACTSTIQDSILLHDSKLLADTGLMDDGFTIRLMRRVIAVCLYEMLIVTIVAQTGDGANKYRRTIDFTPTVNGEDEAQITCGATSLLVKVNWSLMDPVIDQ
uniref:DUF6598 domain-containing protein n=2 Tax=Oryza brachyantha TaxID=4533 RepID=J3NFD3_ORYBR